MSVVLSLLPFLLVRSQRPLKIELISAPDIQNLRMPALPDIQKVEIVGQPRHSVEVTKGQFELSNWPKDHDVKIVNEPTIKVDTKASNPKGD